MITGLMILTGLFIRQRGTAQQKTHGLMRTDVVEKDDHYELNVDLPGYKKEDIELSLDQGYLKISAKKDQNTEEKNKEGKVIRRERYSGSMARSFYVGDDITEEDVQAKFENGVLTVSVPKKDVQKAVKQMAAAYLCIRKRGGSSVIPQDYNPE